MRDVFSAVADPTRRELIYLLARANELPLHELAAHFPPNEGFPRIVKGPFRGQVLSQRLTNDLGLGPAFRRYDSFSPFI